MHAQDYEDEPQLEQGLTQDYPYTGQQYAKISFLDKSTIYFIILLCVMLGFFIGIISVTADNNKKIKNIGVSEELTSLLISEAEHSQSKNGWSTAAISVCHQMCKKAFCKEGFTQGDCEGCSPLDDIDYDDCKLGCLCCDAYNSCRIKNGNDEAACQRQLPECEFSESSLPVHRPDEVCLASVSTLYCPELGIGFNNPIQVA